MRMPALFVTHGGGPMPLLTNDKGHAPLTKWLKGAAKSLVPHKPDAIVCVTAHWETATPMLSTNPSPPMLYDYSGFPPESYEYKYPAAGPPKELTARVTQLLGDAGLSPRVDARRGFDHGTFVPLMLMYPGADIPVLQISILSGSDAKAHIKLGEALAPLRNEGVLIVCSGSSFHNMRGFSGGHEAEAQAFDKWLGDVCVKETGKMRAKSLAAWASAPGGRACHPVGGEEHLMPLLVAAGAGGDGAGRVAHQFKMFSVPVSSFVFE
ncbi:hypothetical protein FOA52_007222 [Chlamydomonas sp. UWO 241]|nr:hypothetical protein FOA52_007222 [Chlamydomonas sp. UWO 241]